MAPALRNSLRSDSPRENSGAMAFDKRALIDGTSARSPRLSNGDLIDRLFFKKTVKKPPMQVCWADGDGANWDRAQGLADF